MRFRKNSSQTKIRTQKTVNKNSQTKIRKKKEVKNYGTYY